MSKLSDYDYDLPREFVAQHPLPERDGSRLMVLHRNDERVEHRQFRDVTEYLRPGDCLVVNDTKVIPARLPARKKNTGGKVEILLLEERADGMWEVLLKPARRLRAGTKLTFADPALEADVVENGAGGEGLVRFSSDIRDFMWQIGATPLPPYIKRPDPEQEDRDRYQTVFAEREGAVAAPTAGLHFTPELISGLREQGVAVVDITLHVGLGTFKPLVKEDVSKNRLHPERFEVSDSAASALNATREGDGRIVAVGTTSVRTLEAVCDGQNVFRPARGRTNLFIYPGHRFRAVDAIITNFHLPRSSLLLLVSAFASRDFVLKAYHEAMTEKYRFYSYGDAMLIL